LILITDIHGDHVDQDQTSLKAVRKAGTEIWAPAAVQKFVTTASVISNGDTKKWDKWIWRTGIRISWLDSQSVSIRSTICPSVRNVKASIRKRYRELRLLRYASTEIESTIRENPTREECIRSSGRLMIG